MLNTLFNPDILLLWTAVGAIIQASMLLTTLLATRALMIRIVPVAGLWVDLYSLVHGRTHQQRPSCHFRM